MKRSLCLFVLIAAVAHAAAAGEFLRAKSPIRGEYIAVLEDRLPSPVETLARDLAKAHRVNVTHVYDAVLNGFAFRGNERAARAISRSAHVKSVEETSLFHLAGSVTQSPVGTGGLDRIDQRFRPLDGSYTYNETGLGTTIYIVDSGVNPVPELSGRILWSLSLLNNDSSTADCANHGTSVATVAAGSVHGVAKQSSIVNLRVATCSGSVSGADLIEALNVIASSHSASQPAVVNLSLFTTDSPTSVRTAVVNLVNRGIPVVAVVPNVPKPMNGQPPSPMPCDTYEPARSADEISGLIGVSAVKLNDVHLTFPDGSTAGAGPCVDIFAPGVNLASNSSGTEVTFTGVSAAAPIISGVVALQQQRSPGSAFAPGSIEQKLKSNGTKDVLYIPGNSVNLLVHSLPRLDIIMPGSLISDQIFDASVVPIAGATYQWNVSNGTIVAGGSSSTVTLRAGCFGPIRADIVVNAPAGRYTGVNTRQIVQGRADVSGDAWINPGDSATIQAYLTGSGPWTLGWNDGVNQTVSSSPAVRTVSPPATEIFWISWMTNGGCSGTPFGAATITVSEE